jgi:flagellar biosynthesis/type III secretory pathway protein FliH
LHEFEYYDSKRGVALGGRSRIITLELSKLGGIVEKPASEMTKSEEWAVFFRYLTDKTRRQKINEIIENEEGIKMANEVLMTITRDEVERAWRLSEEKYILDTQSRIVDAERDGLARGMEKGMMQGIEKGVAQGVMQGQSYVMELLAQGLSYEEIKARLALSERP